MTVRDLIDELEAYDDELEVIIEDNYDFIISEDKDNGELIITLGE